MGTQAVAPGPPATRGGPVAEAGDIILEGVITVYPGPGIRGPGPPYAKLTTGLPLAPRPMAEPLL